MIVACSYYWAQTILSLRRMRIFPNRIHSIRASTHRTLKLISHLSQNFTSFAFKTKALFCHEYKRFMIRALLCNLGEKCFIRKLSIIITFIRLMFTPMISLINWFWVNKTITVELWQNLWLKTSLISKSCVITTSFILNLSVIIRILVFS